MSKNEEEPSDYRSYELEAAALLATTFRPSVPPRRCDCGDQVRLLAAEVSKLRDAPPVVGVFCVGVLIGILFRRRK